MNEWEKATEAIEERLAEPVEPKVWVSMCDHCGARAGHPHEDACIRGQLQEMHGRIDALEKLLGKG